jgi:hypothetical protein
MNIKTMLALLLLALVAGCARQPNQQSTTADNGSASSAANTPAPGGASTSAPAPSSTPSAATPAPAPESRLSEAVENLPAGTVITVKLTNSVGSKLSQSGDRFTATVAEPVQVNGRVAIPAGAPAEGVVSEAAPLGHFKGGALLRLRLESAGGFPVQASLTRSEKGKGKRSAVLIGGGTGLGALIGGLAGGGKGAAIGAVAGAGAGTGGAAFTGNKEIVIPAESAVAFKLSQAATRK